MIKIVKFEVFTKRKRKKRVFGNIGPSVDKYIFVQVCVQLTCGMAQMTK